MPDESFDQSPLSKSPVGQTVKRRCGFGKSLLLLIVLALIGFWLAELFYPRIWLDLVARHTYEAPPAIETLANDLNLTDRAAGVFLASSPSLESAEMFNQHCARREKAVAILGCYDNRQIFVYNVTNTTLSGVVETTAAHELLHAIYVRINQFDKERIDNLLESEYQRLKNESDELSKRLEYYYRNHSDAINNELHSILGTEVANLSPALEKYYRGIFNDRAKIVGYYQKYHQKFTALAERAEALKQEIGNQETAIKTAQDNYQANLDKLNQEIRLFNEHANTVGYFTSQAQFQDARRALVRKVDVVQREHDAINRSIDSYNQLIAEYNNNVTQYQRLNNSLNSLSPAPSL